MDLNVELSNGTKKTIPVPVKCTLKEAVNLIGVRTGLCKKSEELSEFSLAWKDENSDTFINVTWLNPAVPLVDQGVGSSATVLLRKKYFLKNDDLDISSEKNSILLENIYAQLRKSFVAGLYHCTTFQAAQISGMASIVEFSGTIARNARAIKTCGIIRRILPEKYWNIRGIENNIAKAVENVQLTETEAMKAFISRLRKLETFGVSFFTISLDSSSSPDNRTHNTGLLGIGPQYVYKMEVDTLEEPLEQWYTEDLVSYSHNRDVVSLQFGDDKVEFVAEDSESIISFLGGYMTKLTNKEVEARIERSRSRKSLPKKLSKPEKGDEPSVKEVVVVRRIKQPPPVPEPVRNSPERKHGPNPIKRSAPVQTTKPTIVPRVTSEQGHVKPSSVPTSETGPRTSSKPSVEAATEEKSRPSSEHTVEDAVEVAPVPLVQTPSVKAERPALLHNITPESHENVKKCASPPDPVTQPITNGAVTKREEASPEPIPLPPSPKEPSHVQGESDDIAQQVGTPTVEVSPCDLQREEEETVGTPPSKGSPDSMTSRGSTKSEDDKWSENEKKFDTLTRNSKVLHARKERLKALKKKKDENLKDDDIVSLKGTSEVQRRASRKAKEVSKYISLPPQPDGGSLEDLHDLLELDLSKQRWSQEINPIYDITAASEAESLLTSSDVTYEDPNVLKRRSGSEPPLSSPGKHMALKALPSIKRYIDDVDKVQQAQAEVDDIYSRFIDLGSRSGSSASTRSRNSEGDMDTGLYGLVGVLANQKDDIYQVPSTELADDVEEDIYRMPGAVSLPDVRASGRSTSPSHHHQPFHPHAQPSPGIGKRRIIKTGNQKSAKTQKGPTLTPVTKPVEPLKDYNTLKREFRVFLIKTPVGEVIRELVNLNERITKIITRVCALIGSKHPELYSLYLEGSILTALKESENSLSEAIPEEVTKQRRTSAMLDPLGIRGAAFAFLPDQGDQPIKLESQKSFKDHSIYTSRLLALRFESDRTSPEPLPLNALRVPADIKFHQCWLSVIQGIQPCSQEDAVRLAALQYQTYFLDRIRSDSTTAHCKASEFLPVEYASVRNIEDKVLKEQTHIRSYNRRQAQDSYIHEVCTLPLYKAAFFPVKEPRKKFLQNTKLLPMLLGISKDGVMRVDPKTKEVLDFWEYRILKNWAYTPKTFMISFDKQQYPVQTNQGRWINALVEYHINAIVHKDNLFNGNPSRDDVRGMSESPVARGNRKPNLKIDIPTQEDINAIYGEITENGFQQSHETPLITPV